MKVQKYATRRRFEAKHFDLFNGYMRVRSFSLDPTIKDDLRYVLIFKRYTPGSTYDNEMYPYYAEELENIKKNLKNLY